VRKNRFQEYFEVKSSVGTNGWDTGERILYLISRGHGICIDWHTQIVRFNILSSEACLSENGKYKDTQIQEYSIQVELKEFSSLIFSAKITAHTVSSILVYLRLPPKDM